jgi:hypothetical protein
LGKYDLRPEFDTISYEKKRSNNSSKGNTKNIYFGSSGAFIFYIQILDYRIDGVSLTDLYTIIICKI